DVEEHGAEEERTHRQDRDRPAGFGHRLRRGPGAAVGARRQPRPVQDQRRRNNAVLVGGGPEGGIHKSQDGGKTWVKLKKGLPTADVGRIGLAVSPQKPEVVYAHVTAAGKEGGFFRSEDGGEGWTRMNPIGTSDPQYYGEIYADPVKFDKVYMMDLNVMVTEDGGKTFRAA